VYTLDVSDCSCVAGRTSIVAALYICHVLSFENKSVHVRLKWRDSAFVRARARAQTNFEKNIVQKLEKKLLGQSFSAYVSYC